jgi:hypothetical protein
MVENIFKILVNQQLYYRYFKILLPLFYILLYLKHDKKKP